MFYSVLTAADVQATIGLIERVSINLSGGPYVAGGPDKLDRPGVLRHIPEDRTLVPGDDRLFLSAADLVFIIIYLPKGLSFK